jgi:hypothetical protein
MRSARIFPPLFPPARPARACGLSGSGGISLVASPTMAAASRFRSAGFLDRLAMTQSVASWSGLNRPRRKSPAARRCPRRSPQARLRRSRPSRSDRFSSDSSSTTMTSRRPISLSRSRPTPTPSFPARLDGEAVAGTVASSSGGSNEGLLIGAPGFEPGTSPTRTVRATRLRHAPRGGDYPRPGPTTTGPLRSQLRSGRGRGRPEACACRAGR